MSEGSKICLSCGSSRLLRHARPGGVYWLCMSCREEVLPLVARQEPEPNDLKPVSCSIQKIEV